MEFDGTSHGGNRTTTLYLVRHGETEYNRRGIVQGGGIDSEMNTRGRAQARALADRLAPVEVDALYASTLRRAKQTADIVATPHEPIPTTYLEDLNEMDWGIFEGVPPSERRNASMEAIKAAWHEGAYDRAVEEGESIRGVQKRARRAIDEITAREEGGTALVVTHGRYLRVMLATILDEYGLEHMPDLEHSNTCVNRIVHRDGTYRADLLNCTEHLSANTGG